MVGSMWDFGGRYCEPTSNPWTGGNDYLGATNLAELNAILEVQNAFAQGAYPTSQAPCCSGIQPSSNARGNFETVASLKRGQATPQQLDPHPLP